MLGDGAAGPRRVARQDRLGDGGVLAGDAVRARRAVTEHLDGTAALLRGFLAAPSPAAAARSLSRMSAAPGTAGYRG